MILPNTHAILSALRSVGTRRITSCSTTCIRPAYPVARREAVRHESLAHHNHERRQHCSKTTASIPFRPPSSPLTKHAIIRGLSTSTTTTTPTAPPPSALSGPAFDSATPPAPHLEPYKPPTTGLISYLPTPLIPFAELSRLDKLSGATYLFFPCVFSTLLAAPLSTALTTFPQILGTTSLFLLGAIIMRGAGCTVNDLWDRNIDPKVERTRLRPIARRAVGVPAAIVWFGTQCLAGLVVLLQFPQPTCFYYAAPSLLFVVTYPLAKRVTHYPQFVLGLTFSWGAMMGFPALGIDLLAPENSHVLASAALLYASCVSWTVMYDMIYACMDLRDDVAAGIKSIALRHAGHVKAVLSGLACVQVALLAAAGFAVGAGSVFYAGSCGGAAATLATIIWRVNVKNVASCWWWFRYGCWFTGSAISAGLLGEYFVRRGESTEELPQ